MDFSKEAFQTKNSPLLPHAGFYI